MKRPLIATLIVGIFVVRGGERTAARSAGRCSLNHELRIPFLPTVRLAHVVPKQWQYVFMSILAFGVAALTATSLRRGRIGVLVIGLLIELAAVAWICGLYKVFFQPFPSMLAVVLAFVSGRSLHHSHSTRSIRSRPCHISAIDCRESNFSA